jgi:two-component sensor histidine kinase
MMQMTESPSNEPLSLEARLLLREFSHRINNEFASAIGMISVAAAHLANAEAKAALAAVEDQLHNYARVNYALQMPEHNSRIDAAAYLRQLCRAICYAKLNAKGIKLLLVERTFQMDSERCWRLGLIVSELITNHAFRDNRGLIRVELLPSASIIECRVTDKQVYRSPGHRNEDHRQARQKPWRHASTAFWPARSSRGPHFPG